MNENLTPPGTPPPKLIDNLPAATQGMFAGKFTGNTLHLQTRVPILHKDVQMMAFAVVTAINVFRSEDLIIGLGKIQIESGGEYIVMRVKTTGDDADVTFKVSDKKKVHKLDGMKKFENRIIKHFEMTAV